ncbi:MAG TPA: hypothetical protein VGX78_17815 [Pirellulales bacterium]|nr:hypothetical protein [Pirellulales bacterium]
MEQDHLAAKITQLEWHAFEVLPGQVGHYLPDCQVVQLEQPSACPIAGLSTENINIAMLFNHRMQGCFSLFAIPSDTAALDSPITSYAVITGAGTMFEGDQPTSVRDVPDGFSNTLLVVEAAQSNIHWMEPRDLDFERMTLVVNASGGQDIASRHEGIATGAWVDGSWYQLNETTPAKLLRALITRNGHEPTDEAH